MQHSYLSQARDCATAMVRPNPSNRSYLAFRVLGTVRTNSLCGGGRHARGKCSFAGLRITVKTTY
uniref:Uncharacterized protein n=1 Tax=Amphimedon queenslandica TaxID=400682 RepID=A0A1X7UBW4_AMPQE